MAVKPYPVGNGETRVYPGRTSNYQEDILWHTKGKQYWNEFGELLSHADRIEYSDLAAKIHFPGPRTAHPILRRAQRNPTWASFVLLRFGFGEHADWASLAVGKTFTETYSPTELVSPVPNYQLSIMASEELTIWKERWRKIVEDTKVPFPHTLSPGNRGSGHAKGPRHNNPHSASRHSLGNPSTLSNHQAVHQSPSAHSEGHSPQPSTMPRVARFQQQDTFGRHNATQQLPVRPLTTSSQVYRPGSSYDIPPARTAAESARSEERNVKARQHDQQQVAPPPDTRKRIPAAKKSKQVQIPRDDRLKTPKYVKSKTRVPLPHESGLQDDDFEDTEMFSELNNSTPCQAVPEKPGQQKKSSTSQDPKGRQRAVVVPQPSEIVYISEDEDEDETTFASPGGAAARHRASSTARSSSNDDRSPYTPQQDTPTSDVNKKRRAQCEGDGSPKKKKKSARSKEIAALKSENNALRGERDAVRGESRALKELTKTLRKKNEDLEEENRKLRMEKERRARGKTVG